MFKVYAASLYLKFMQLIILTVSAVSCVYSVCRGEYMYKKVKEFPVKQVNFRYSLLPEDVLHYG